MDLRPRLNYSLLVVAIVIVLAAPLRTLCVPLHGLRSGVKDYILSATPEPTPCERRITW